MYNVKMNKFCWKFLLCLHIIHILLIFKQLWSMVLSLTIHRHRKTVGFCTTMHWHHTISSALSPWMNQVNHSSTLHSLLWSIIV